MFAIYALHTTYYLNVLNPVGKEVECIMKVSIKIDYKFQFIIPAFRVFYQFHASVKTCVIQLIIDSQTLFNGRNWDNIESVYSNMNAMQGGPERMQHLRSTISRKRGTEWKSWCIIVYKILSPAWWHQDR